MFKPNSNSYTVITVSKKDVFFDLIINGVIDHTEIDEVCELKDTRLFNNKFLGKKYIYFMKLLDTYLIESIKGLHDMNYIEDPKSLPKELYDIYDSLSPLSYSGRGCPVKITISFINEHRIINFLKEVTDLCVMNIDDNLKSSVELMIHMIYNATDKNLIQLRENNKEFFDSIKENLNKVDGLTIEDAFKLL